MYWHWIDGIGDGEENTVLCEICRETRGPLGEWWTEDSLNEWATDHLRDDHNIETADPSAVNVLTVWEIREREIIGFEYSSHSRDCDGPHEYYSNNRLPEGMTWSQYVGREITSYPPEGFTIHNDGLAFEWGGPTDEGYSGTSIVAVFRHEEYKLEEPDRQRDVYAEQMGY